MEYVLDPSIQRIRAIGIFTLFAHIPIYLAWTLLEPQPFDNFWLRLGLTSLGVPLVLPEKYVNPFEKTWQIFTAVVCWVQLPAFMTLMFFANGRNNEWLVCLCAMPLIYFHLTDWRLATLGIAIAWAIGLTLQATHWWSVPSIAGSGTGQLLVFVFCWVSALGLRISAVNLKRAQNEKTRETIAYLAHELRTPISAIALASQQLNTTGGLSESSATRLGEMLDAITIKMYSKIDRVLFNANIYSLATSQDDFNVADALTAALADFCEAEITAKQIISMDMKTSFVLTGDFRELQFVFNNLLTNAFSALARRDTVMTYGDVRVVVDADHKSGFISIEDKGVGIALKDLPRVFDPYFTTHGTLGLGLGMTYCKAAVRRLKGTIQLESSVGKGTTVRMTFPLTSSSRY